MIIKLIKLSLKSFYNIIGAFFPYLLLIIIWQSLIIIFKLPDYVLPSFIEVIKTMVIHKKLLLYNSFITSLEAITGVIIACIFSIILGSIFNYFKLVNRFIYSLILVWQILPLMAIAPLILIWLGFGIFPKIIVVFLGCLFPCLISFMSGIKSINHNFIDLMKSMGASKLQVFKIVQFPSSLYALFSGIKISVIYSLTSAVVAEYLGADKGLGVYMSRALSSFDTPSLFGIIVCIVFITLILYKIVNILEKIIMPWQRINLNKELKI